MANRGATADIITEVAKSANQPLHLVQVEFDDETVYMTDSYKNIVWGGHTYHALGHLISLGDIEETVEVQVTRLSASLSGVDQTYISAFLSKEYTDRPFRIYKAFLDSNEAVIADPILMFEGQMDGPVIEEDPESGISTVSVSITNQWVDFERKPGRHTNHEEQQIHFPGDKGFEFASEIVKDILWGRA